MPYKDIEKRREYGRELARKRRERLRAQQAEADLAARIAAGEVITDAVAPVSDTVRKLGRWCEDVLRVPAGHPLAGKPMPLLPFAREFLDAVYSSDRREAALSVARKNGKSALIAQLLLAYLLGPIRFDGFRAAVASVTKEKANELRRQLIAIAHASGLTLTERGMPLSVESETGIVEMLSSARTAGHASSYDIVICDETGLFPDKSRDWLMGLRTSVSAKDGRVIHISIRGDSEIYGEILASNAVTVRKHFAPDDCAIDDVDAWHQANPALGSAKQVAYMEDQVRRVKSMPKNESLFRAYDLNQAVDPERELLVSLSEFDACCVSDDQWGDRGGTCALGIDLGGSRSMTAAVAIWPSGRVDCWGAFADDPPLQVRARQDGIAYGLMTELQTYAGRVTPVGAFLHDVFTDIGGAARIGRIACDRFRRADAEQALMDAGIPLAKLELRGMGASAVADGSADVRSFQTLIADRKIRFRTPALLMRAAIAGSKIDTDRRGNPALNKANSKSRIDACSAGVLAAGLHARRRAPREIRFWTARRV